MLILETVGQIRKLQPRMGVHKLNNEIKLRLGPMGILIGKNRLNELLRKHHLLIKPNKVRKPRTTNSNHWHRKWPNLIQGFVPDRPEQLVVCDITYWRTEEGWLYLSLATDAYSHMVLGHAVCANLYAAGPMAAMETVIENRVYPQQAMIHHSDRGIQYCSNAYVAMLQHYDISISMTQSGDPTENAIAERMNGLLKQFFGLPQRFADWQSAVESIAQAIQTYNYEFPHGSIDYLKPYQAHRISGPIKNRWKKQ